MDDRLWPRTAMLHPRRRVSSSLVKSHRIADGCQLYSFDLALPTECDDEYWLTPEGEPLFKQPPGKPSRVTTFVCMLRLGQILALVMRTIVSNVSENLFRLQTPGFFRSTRPTSHERSWVSRTSSGNSASSRTSTPRSISGRTRSRVTVSSVHPASGLFRAVTHACALDGDLAFKCDGTQARRTRGS